MTADVESVIGRVMANGERHASKTAIAFGARRMSYSELCSDIAGWSARFQAVTKPGEVALVFLPQSPEAIAAFFGAMHAGAIPALMPLPSGKQDPKAYWSAHQALLELIRPAAIVTTGEHADALRGISRAAGTSILTSEAGTGRSADIAMRHCEVALLQHSSGTTGLKKGVALSHVAVIRQVRLYAAAIGAGADDVVVSWLPLYHDMGLIACTVMPFMLGQTLVLLDPFDWVAAPATLFDAIAEHRGTLAWLPNFSFEHLRRTVRADGAARDLSSMRAWINCSEPCKPRTFERFAAAFGAWGVKPSDLQVCYAMAETVFAVSQTRLGEPVRRLRVRGESLLAHEVVPDPAGDVELLSCGPLLPGCRVEIESDARRGDAASALTVGEIVVAAPFLFEGYYRRPERTAEVLAGGRYRTRDLGFMHDGELFVLGRKDDLLISNGRNYFAHEIEQIANGVEGVKAGRNVAVGIFNAEIGSEEVYLVQETAEMPADRSRELRKSVREAVEEQLGLTLRDVVVVPPGWLAKTTSGKISRESNKLKLGAHLAERKARARSSGALQE